MISHKYKFIFFHVPKAAGSSITAGIKKKLGKDVTVNDQNKNLVKWLKNRNININWPNHTPPQVMLQYLGPQKFYSYFKFAFVRHPFDRLVSMYHYTKQKEEKIYAEKGIPLPQYSLNIINSPSFADWVISEQFGNPQYDFLSKDDNLLVDYVGATENLQADFSYICGLLNIPNIIVPHKNKSKHDDTQDYLQDAKVKEVIHRGYQKDFNHFYVDNDYSLNIKPSIKCLYVTNSNEWTKIPEDFSSSILMHPNPADKKTIQYFFLVNSPTKKKLKLHFKTFNPNMNADHSVIVKVQNHSVHHDSTINFNMPKLSDTEKVMDLKLYNNLIEVRLNLPENAVMHYYCGLKLWLKLT